MAKEYYELLGVSENASQDKIKKAYRKRLKKNIIRILTAIQPTKKNSRRSIKHTMFSLTKKKKEIRPIRKAGCRRSFW